MNYALNVCAEWPDVRCGRLSLAMQAHGWRHDVLTSRQPTQFTKGYDKVMWSPQYDYDDFLRIISEHKAPIAHVHGELYALWPAIAAKEAGKKVVLNIHDLASARPGSLFDAYEEEAFKAADALVFTTQAQLDWAKDSGLDCDKPTVIVTNYASSTIHLKKSSLPYIGGICYGGGALKRDSDPGIGRDFSPVADALDGKLYIYSGSGDPDYGTVMKAQVHYTLYIQHLARHDWGFSGYHAPHPGWVQSMPTKATEYFAAGLPIISMNTPELIPFCEMGMGVHIEDLRDLKKIAKLDVKPYRKAVMANRGRFTTEAIIEPLADLFRGLL